MSVSTPLPQNIKIGIQFCPTDDEAMADMRKVPYRELVGILMYIANGTRPDIAHSVNMLAQVASNPGRLHWSPTKHLVRYLKGTQIHQLVYGSSSEGLIGYTDASFG